MLVEPELIFQIRSGNSEHEKNITKTKNTHES